MCLYVKGKEIKTAEEDIVCYKVLKIDRNFLDQECAYTPYTGLQIGKCFLKGEADFHAFGPSDIKLENLYSSRYEVSCGFVHTCSDLESAKKLCECLLTFTCPMVVIYKCIIPKGTEYYEGVWSFSAESSRASYASKKIRFVKEIKKIK
jgi:hypothetical protein